MTEEDCFNNSQSVLKKSHILYICFFILFRHFVPPSPKAKACGLIAIGFIFAAEIQAAYSPPFLQTFHKQKVFKFNMLYRTCGIIDIVVGDNDFLRKIIYIFKCGKLFFVRLIFGNAVSHLHEILF